MITPAHKTTTGIAGIAILVCLFLFWQSCKVKNENENLQQLTRHQVATIDSCNHIISYETYILKEDSVTILHYRTYFERARTATETYVGAMTQIFNAVKSSN